MTKHTRKFNHVEGDHPLAVAVEFTGDDIFVTADGKKIAKRGHPGTPEAGTWVSLRRGWAVKTSADFNEIVVTCDGIVRN